MTKNKVQQSVIELRLEASLVTTKAIMRKWLVQTARDCNRARNAMMDAYRDWRRLHPDWTPDQRRRKPKDGKPGAPAVDKDGKPIMEDPCISQDLENELYYAGCRAAPNVATKIIAACRNEVVKYLKAKMPYNHEGDAKQRYEAILSHEVSAPSYREFAIPTPTQDSLFAYCGIGCGMPEKTPMSLGKPTKESIRRTILGMSKSTAMVAFPMFSARATVKNKKHIARVEVRQLKDGHRQLLKRIASGKIGFSDSKIVQKDNGDWSFQLTYKIPSRDHKLDKSRKAILTPMPPGSRWPFELRFPDGSTWGIGDGRMYEEIAVRVDDKRRKLRNRYKRGGGRGHGRNRFHEKLKPRSRAVVDAQATMQKIAVADVLKKCIERNCGTFEYREPSLGFRKALWFAKRGKSKSRKQGLDFAWDKFGTMLRHKLTANCIDIPKRWQRIKSKEHREQYAKEWEKSK